MKKFLFVALSLLALPSVASAIVVNGGVNPAQDFGVSPLPTTDWATGAIAGANTAAADLTALNGLVNPTAESAYTAALAVSATFPPATAIANWRQNFGNANGRAFAQSDPTGVAANVMKATLTNGTPNYITSLGITFDVGLENFTPAEEIPGVALYWSPTGAANSWTSLGLFNTGNGQTANISGIGTGFGNNPAYLLFVDDNASGTEGYYSVDNVVLNATLGGPIVVVPPTPVFGNVSPTQTQNFETPGTGLPMNNGANGTLTTINGTQALQVNGTVLDATTDQVDLRGVAASSQKVVSVDLKAWETSAGSDFEDDDRIAVIAQWSADGLTFTDLPLVDLHGVTRSATTVPPYNDAQPDPLDQIRGQFGPTSALNSATEPFHHFSVTLPSAAKTVRVRTILDTDSTSEFAAVDNLMVAAVAVPEPATVAMFGLGMIGLVGYGVRRRRSA